MIILRLFFLFLISTLVIYCSQNNKRLLVYYSIMFQYYGITEEATAVPHAGLLRFIFSENKQSRIQIDHVLQIGGISNKL